MGITIPDFTQDSIDTPDGGYDEMPHEEYVPSPSQPNIVKVFETKPFGKSALWVSELRRRLGLTQEAMAQAIGCSSATVGGWERGTSQPADPKHRTALHRAGQSRMMPELPPVIGGGARPYVGPRIDPHTEELFKQHFGG